MATPFASNPNATVAVGTGTLGVGVAWLLGNVFHITVSAEAGGTIATVIAGFALYVGRFGIRGLVGRVWKGQPPPANPPAPPAAPLP